MAGLRPPLSHPYPQRKRAAVPTITNWGVSVHTGAPAHGARLEIAFPISVEGAWTFIYHPAHGETFPTVDDAWNRSIELGLVVRGEKWDETSKSLDRIVRAAARRATYAAAAREVYADGDHDLARALLYLTGYEGDADVFQMPRFDAEAIAAS